MYNDLTVKGGRLINNRPDSVTGIQQAAAIKKELKKAQKVEMYSKAVALGVEIAESNKKLRLR